MFREVFRFELRQQLARPAFWLIVFAFAAIGVLEMTGPGVSLLGVHEGVSRNAPVVIANGLAVFCVLATLAAAVFVAGAALRDHDHRMEGLMGSLPVSRHVFQGGRFAAAWVLVLAAMLACTIGMAIGNALPGYVSVAAGPPNVAGYSWAFAVIALPGTLFVCALLFLLASLTRSLLATYVGTIVLLALLLLSHLLMRNASSQIVAALLDPFGDHTLQFVARYWSASEINTRVVPLDGMLLFNRAFWGAAGLVLLALLLAFDFKSEGVRVRRRREDVGMGTVPIHHDVAVPHVEPRTGAFAQWRQFRHWLAFDARRVLGGTPFLVVLLLALFMLVGNLYAQPTLLGVKSYPVAWDVIGAIRSSFEWLLAITVVFYAGELAWRERDLRVAEVADASPWPLWVAVAAKCCVLAVAIAVFLACGALVGMGWQVLHGYTHVQPLLYLQTLSLEAIPCVLLAVLCLFVQVLCGSRLVGYVLTVLWLIASRFGALALGWRDHLFVYGSTSRLLHSGFNGFGRFLRATLWFDFYWLLLAIALLLVAGLFWMRGAPMAWRLRLREAQARFRAPVGVVLALALLAFVGCGAWIFHNTHGLDSRFNARQFARERAHYEKAYAHFRNLPQPRIASANLDVAIFPAQHRLDIHGRYTLVNRSGAPIDTLLVWYPKGFDVRSVHFAPHAIVSEDEVPHFAVYELQQPLQPGAALPFDFDLEFSVRGFGNGPADTELVGNGTFFDNEIGPDRTGHNVLPHIGYQPYLELIDARSRRAFALPPAESPMGALDDPKAREQDAAAGDAGWTHFDVTLSTAAGQTAITSGGLDRAWTASGRSYFHYVTAAPVPGMLPFLSARYAVRRTQWHGIGIEVYYPPQESANADRMLRAARDALAWDSTHYGAYPFHQLRLAVVPYNYAFAAEAFPAGVVVVRETGAAGPLAGPHAAGAIDPLYGLLAHEISHEWWAYQELPANVRGMNLITESLAQYSELMVLKQRYGAAALHPLLRYLLDSYLQGRRRTAEPESPLDDTGDIRQGYIYYDRGALAMYTLADYVGEDKVNDVLRQFLAATRFRPPPYPTSMQFVDLLRAGVAPEWRPLVDDLFTRITLHDDRLLSATATKLPDGKYAVTLHVHAAEFYADGKGNRTQTKLDIPIEIGVFARSGAKPLYFAKIPVKDGDSTITMTVDGRPYEAGIDPFNELVDPMPDDNRARVKVESRPWMAGLAFARRGAR